MFLVIILDQKSPVAVRWLPPHRGRRSVKASLVELSLKTHLSVAMSWLCVILTHKSTTGVCQLRYRRRRCSEASLVQFSHKTQFTVAMSFFLSCRNHPEEWTRNNNSMSGGDLYRHAVVCLFRCFSAQACFHFCSSSARHKTAQRWTCAPSTTPPNC